MRPTRATARVSLPQTFGALQPVAQEDLIGKIIKDLIAEGRHPTGVSQDGQVRTRLMLDRPRPLTPRPLTSIDLSSDGEEEIPQTREGLLSLLRVALLGSSPVDALVGAIRSDTEGEIGIIKLSRKFVALGRTGYADTGRLTKSTDRSRRGSSRTLTSQFQPRRRLSLTGLNGA